MAGDFNNDFNNDFSTDTTIDLLPTYSIRFGIGCDDDFELSLAFLNSDGTPMVLDGIAFSLSLGGRSTLTPDVVGNVVTAFLPASQKSGWFGATPLSLLATDSSGSPSGGLRSVGVLTRSALKIGSASPPILTKVIGGPTIILSSVPPRGGDVPVVSAGGIHVGTDLNIGSTEL